MNQPGSTWGGTGLATNTLRRRLFVALLVPLAFCGSIVGAETYVEYQTWKDQEWGVLEHLFAITTAGLQPVPDWRCVDPPEPIAPSPVHVHTFYLVQPDAQTNWADEVAARLPAALEFQPMQPAGDLEGPWAFAQQHRNAVILVYTDQHYRGPVLNDRLEGFACGNVAVINIEVDCPESIVAHEIGHVLGLRHASSGLMRARGVGCDDTLLDQQSLWLKQRYAPMTDGFMRDLDADSAEQGSAGNGNAEPDADRRVL